MALEPSKNQAAGGSWWGGFVNMVKAQAETVVNVYKEDLQEFTKTIKDDTKEVIQKTAASEDNIASQITTGISGLLGLQHGKSSKGSKDATVIAADRHHSRLLSLQSELSTYCTDPADLDDYAEWQKTFTINEKTDEISRLLTSNEKVREIHTKVVPLAVTYNDFWSRYYYKAHKLEQEEQRRLDLVNRAAASSSPDELEIGWDDETDDVAPVAAEADVPPPREVEQYLESLDAHPETPPAADDEPTGLPSVPATTEPSDEADAALSEEEEPSEATAAPAASASAEVPTEPVVDVAEAPASPPASLQKSKSETKTPAETSPAPAPTKPAGPARSGGAPREGEGDWDNWE